MYRKDPTADSEYNISGSYDDRRFPTPSTTGGYKLPVLTGMFQLGPNKCYELPVIGLVKALVLCCPNDSSEFNPKLHESNRKKHFVDE